MPRTLASRVTIVSRIRYIFHYPLVYNYLVDSGRSNVKMLAVSSFINTRNRIFEKRGIHEIVIDRPE
jgi:hypothetical protein